MHKAISLIFTITLITLASCSSNKPPKGTKTIFKTRITDSSLKHFQVSFHRIRSSERDQGSRRSSDRRERSNRKSNNNTYKKLQKQLVQFAEIEIERSDYCRKGFWILKNEADAMTPYLRGECNEQATPADRQKFPDTLNNW